MQNENPSKYIETIMPSAIKVYGAIPQPNQSNIYFTWLESAQAHYLTEYGRKEFFSTMQSEITVAHPSVRNLVAKYPGIKFNLKNNRSNSFQGFNLLWYFPEIAFTREDLALFFEKLKKFGLKGSGDPIQSVNKADQNGFRIKKLRGSPTIYQAILPVPYDPSKIVLRIVSNTKLSAKEKEEQIARIKEYVQTTFINEKTWEAGHLDPNSDSSAIVMQPGGYQRARRDRFKFDEWGLVLCPTVKELGRNFDKYYPSQKEQQEIYNFLKEKLNES